MLPGVDSGSRSLKTMKRWHEFRAWVVGRVPLPFLLKAHELAVTGVLLVLGVPALLGVLPAQGGPYDPLPFPAWELWGAALTTGALLTHWGIFRARPRAEWAGQMIAGWGLFFWAVILGTLLGMSAYVTVAVFLILALVSWWRAFKITSAALIQLRVTEAAREAHVTVHENGGGRHHE